MKRSKIFLAGTTCLLAIAGVAATKAHKGVTRAVYFTSSNGVCTAAKVTHCSVNSGANICRTGAIHSKTLYTQSSASFACNGVAGNHVSHFNAQ